MSKLNTMLGVLGISLVCLTSCSDSDALHENIMTENIGYSLADFNRSNTSFPEIKDNDYTQNYLNNLAILYNLDTNVNQDNIDCEIVEDEDNGFVILYYNTNEYNKVTYMLWSYDIEDNLITNLELKRTLLQESE
jgi:hypothetical protein